MDDYDKLMKDTVQYGVLGLSLAMAQETGIVRVLCHADTPLTSTQIASRARLKERYVRELLGCLVSARVVELSPGSGTGGRNGQEARYRVPPERRQALDKTSKTSLYLSAMARQFDTVKNVFHEDGPDSIRFPDSHFDLVDEVGPVTFNRLVELMLDSQDVRQKLESGADVAELGSGKGWYTLRLAAMFPNTRFTATDIRHDQLDRAQQQAEADGLKNVTTQTTDPCDTPKDWNEQFDWVFAVNTIQAAPHPQKLFDNVYRALRPGGVFSLTESCISCNIAENYGDDRAVFLYATSTFSSLPDSYRQADSEAQGACLGEERVRQMMKAAGLRLLDVAMVEEMGHQAVFNCQKPD